MKKTFLLPLLSSFLFFGCAKEQSKEQEKREEVNRQMERLQKAEGLYEGHLEQGTNSFTPVAFKIEAKRNPRSGDETPTLQVTMQIGLFGGVVISSDQASFDYGQNLVTASFTRSSGPALELKGQLGDEEIKTFILSGPNSGSTKAKLREVKFWTPPASDLLEPQFLIDFPVEGSRRQQKAQGLLSLKRKAGDLKAPDHVDLPYLPNLEASLRLQGTAQVPQVATLVVYDPLKGTMEIGLKSASKIELTNIFLGQNSRGEMSLGELSGQLSQRSFSRQGMKARVATAESGREFESNFALPPTYFKGHFTGVKSHLKYRVLAELTYTGQEVNNSGELFFPTFPGLKLKVWSCMGEKTWTQVDYYVNSLDHLALKASLKSNIVGKDQSVEMHVSPDWKTLEAQALGFSGGGETENPEFHLESYEANGRKLTCQTY